MQGSPKNITLMKSSMDNESSFRILIGKPERKRPLWRPRSNWKDNIKIDLTEIMHEEVEYFKLAFDMPQWRTFADMVMNFKIA